MFSTARSPSDEFLVHEETVSRNKFEVTSPYHPSGDQPQAIDKLVEQVSRGDRFSVLRGITGTGKTHVMAHTIARLGRPTLVLCHNKTLAGQLCRELKSSLSNNHVELFISYYDLFMPESYNEVTGKYRAKKTKINKQTNQRRHLATRALVEHSDVVIVASISCIFGMGMPSAYLDATLRWTVGDTAIDSIDSIRVAMETAGYTCVDSNDDADDKQNDDTSPGQFALTENATGAELVVWPPAEQDRIRVDFTCQDDGFYKIVAISKENTGKPIPSITIFPAKHHVISSNDAFDETLRRIECELQDQVKEFMSQNKREKAEMLSKRVSHDLIALRESRTCPGIENYSRHMALREAGEPPETLLDYFNSDKWLLIVDESHATLPQIGLMYKADRSRKLKLVKHGYRLPSALDNRPLQAEEFWHRVSQAIFVSATPANQELTLIQGINDPIDMVIRPTYVCDPTIQVLPKDNQLDVLLQEIKDRASRQERTLAIAYTKRDAEDLASYLLVNGVNTTYIHSGVKTHERSFALQSLQRGEIDCLVGVNLLREGLDLPQVSLVAILQADSEGFLRSETMLVQTIGRAARNINGTAILFANRITESMRNCIDTTNHRRQLQLDYNVKHGKEMKTTRTSSVTSIFELEKEKQAAYEVIDWDTEIGSINRGGVDKLMEAEQNRVKQIIDVRNGIITDHIPNTPGVYLWQDAAGEILYIGKAKKLRTRVKSYLASNAKHGTRIQAMMMRAARVEIILTPSDRDALLLESNMIKHHQPAYNVLLKDDDSYPYICASIGDEYPRFMITPGRQKGEESISYKYFGPYPHYSEINAILQGIEEKYDLRSKSFQARYGEVTKEAYQELFQTALSEVFETKGNPMDSSLPALRVKFEEGSYLFESEYNNCRDVVAIGQAGDDHSVYVVHVLQLREGIIAGQFSYTFEWEPGLITDQDIGDAIQTILEQRHYPSGELALSGHFSFFPDEILTEYPLLDTKALKESVILARNAAESDQQRYKVAIRTAARRGHRREADERALKCAVENAAQKAREHIEKRFADGKASLELASLLSLPRPPERIECYDISHTQGEATVGSRVVFLNGQPAPHLYRRFIVRNVVGVDDYASLEEVLERRFRNVWLKQERLVEKSDPWGMPDLVVIDGGKGQLSSAVKGMAKAHVYPLTMELPDDNHIRNGENLSYLGITSASAYVPVIALAKNKEEVFSVDKSDPINENPDSPALLLLRSIRDESHRFALRFHRQRRSRANGLTSRGNYQVPVEERAG